MTSSTTTAALGGLAGADAFCQTHADAAGLVGTFSALLWNGTGQAPASRLAGSRGWVDTIGRPIADSPVEFDQAGTYYPIEHDEHGQPLEGSAFTGRNAISGAACDGWTTASTDTVQVAHSSGTLFARSPLSGNCDRLTHLYCTEYGRSVAVAPVPESGRIAFLSTGTFEPGTGIATADALCASEAVGAMLPGEYRAFLGTAAGGPESRFAPGEPWRRVDGVRLSQTSDAMLSTSSTVRLDTFLNRRADGSVWDGMEVWTGSNLHCSSWLLTTGSGTTGDPGSTYIGNVRSVFPFPCALTTPHVICMQL